MHNYCSVSTDSCNLKSSMIWQRYIDFSSICTCIALTRHRWDKFFLLGPYISLIKRFKGESGQMRMDDVYTPIYVPCRPTSTYGEIPSLTTCITMSAWKFVRSQVLFTELWMICIFSIDCTESYSLHQFLPDHFFQKHRAFKIGDHEDNLLRHARKTSRFISAHKQKLPPFPTHPVPCILLNEVANIVHPKPLGFPDGPSQSQSLLGKRHRRHRGRLGERKAAQQTSRLQRITEESSEEEDECDARLVDLKHNTASSPSRPVLRRRVKEIIEDSVEIGAETGLSAPVPPRHAGGYSLPMPPQSFGFEKVCEMEEEG